MKKACKLFLVIAASFFSCKDLTIEKKSNSFDTIAQRQETKLDQSGKVKTDTVYKLLHNSINLDTFEFRNYEPFLFIKTGNFLKIEEKSALIISCPNDDIFKIEYYSKSDEKWVKIDELSLSDAFPIQFEIKFDDYNFDNQNDIYLQSSVSVGYALSRGHLLTIDPITKQLLTHPETRDLANMHLDKKSKTVISEDVDWDRNYGFQGVCDLNNKWINGKLKTIKKECPSKNPKGYN